MCASARLFAALLVSCPGAWSLRLAPTASLEPGDAKFFAATPGELANATKGYLRAAEQARRALKFSTHNASTDNLPVASWGTANSSDNFPAEPSFQSFVDGHSKGRGVWKWNNALTAYQRHFAALAGHEVHMAEVGVQSGGSIDMWQSVLGSGCHVHGIDINKACTKFTNGRTTITIGDQADPAMWNTFFTETAPKLNILVDDGGHEAHQMRTTLVEVFYRLQPGGVIAIEDIHGQHYIESFFTPAASYLAHMAKLGEVESVHVYPYLLIAQKSGQAPGLPKARISFSDTNPVVVDSFDQFWDKAPYSRGRTVEMRNPSWGNFLTASGLTNFFAVFAGLHDFSMVATPTGCETTPAPRCRVDVTNSPTQALVSGVHVFGDHALIELPPSPPLITAVRAGTEWQSYASK